MFRPKGIIASLITNFTKDGKLDLPGLKRNISFHKNSGVQGVCVLGGTGEPISLTTFEREQVMETAAEACGGQLDLVVGAMVGDPTQVLQDVKLALKYKAKACLVTSPPFVRPSEGDVERFFSDLGAQTDMPLILFNAPSRSGFLMSFGLVKRLAENVETIIGLKESSRDILLLSKVRATAPPEFSILQGVDSLFLPSLVLGADGGLLAAAAVFPEICTALYQAILENHLKKAAEYHYLLMPFIEVMYEASHPGPLKYALELRELPAGPTRPPLYGLTEDHAKRVKKCVGELMSTFKLRRGKKIQKLTD